MKRLIHIFTVVFVLTACNQESILETDREGMEFTARTESFKSSTKAALNDNNSIRWSENDRIAVFQGCSFADEFEVTDASDSRVNGTFRMVPAEGREGNVPGAVIPDNVAVYPYSANLELVRDELADGEDIAYHIYNVEYPRYQYYGGESFSNDAFVMVAVTDGVDDRNLRFWNVSGAIRLHIRGNASIVRITIEGNNGETLSGYANIMAYKDGSTPVVEAFTTVSEAVYLYCGDGVRLNEEISTEFVLTIPPTVFEKGFTVKIKDVNNVISEYMTEKRETVNRSRVLDMPEIILDDPSVPSQPDQEDYIDEYGVNHGSGIKIDGVVWAPVNCGYHKTDFKYGKLYQWGRKYGQGYEGILFSINGKNTSEYSDASLPVIADGGVSVITGNRRSNADVFYTGNSNTYQDWVDAHNEKLWNIGTESNPVKTEYDPCPEGWRVPTYLELEELQRHHSYWTSEDGLPGCWFSGAIPYTDDAPQVFLPAAGDRGHFGEAGSRGRNGIYWSSRPSNNDVTSDGLYFYRGGSNMARCTRASGWPLRCVKYDGELIPVSSVTLSETSLTLPEGGTSVLSATINPSDANHQSAHWSSEDPSIATVDEDGTVIAVSAGTTTITAIAGMKIATCKVTVTTASDQNVYIDEYGINQGFGVEIDGVVWAPVNCGYHEKDFKYGKLYQWGRKYGQGYDGPIYDVNGSNAGTYSDSSVPTINSGPVTLSTGQSKSRENCFYKVTYSPYDWLSPQNDKLWNSGTESKPVKTEYDPCPEGWRVPTYAELNELSKNSSSWTTEDGQVGYWFSGASSYTDEVPQIFFPAAGGRISYVGGAYIRASGGCYWSSNCCHRYRDCDDSYCLSFDDGTVSMRSSYRAEGFSVRCVQE